MKRYTTLLLLFVATNAFALSDTQLFKLLSNGGDEAYAWYNAHPQIHHCVEKKEGATTSPVSAAMRAEWAVECRHALTSARKKKKKGDVVDTNPNATPNTPQDAKKRSQHKAWQDNSGFIHYPDGSVTNSPAD